MWSYIAIYYVIVFGVAACMCTYMNSHKCYVIYFNAKYFKFD